MEFGFRELANYYDKWIQKALPCFKDVFSIATEIITFSKNNNIKVLDLGAGTGIFSNFIFKKFINANFILYDVADKMLKIAKQRFKNNLDQFQFIVDDYRNLKTKNLGKFDLIISSLSIHHLKNSEKKNLFKDIFEVLKKNGIFLNIDQIKGETDCLQKIYWDKWLKKTRKNGGNETQIKSSIKRREDYDKDALLFNQIKWLKKAGFSDVDCVYKNYFIGLFFATKK